MHTIHIYPRNVCSVEMFVDYDDNHIIQEVRIIRGCRGNTQGLAALLKGMTLEEAVARLDGIQCRNGTSCPDQLAKGIKNHLAKE